MFLDIDGAGRSRSLACLPTARGTAAPTRGQVPGGVFFGTSTGPFCSHYPKPSGRSSGRGWLVFSRVDRHRQASSLQGPPPETFCRGLFQRPLPGRLLQGPPPPSPGPPPRASSTPDRNLPQACKASIPSEGC